MSDWQHKLNIKAIWEQASARTITPQQMSEGIAKAIKKLSCFARDEELQQVHEAFVDWATNPATTWEDTDSAMAELYDWGDTVVDESVWPHKKKCWIVTMS